MAFKNNNYKKKYINSDDLDNFDYELTNCQCNFRKNLFSNKINFKRSKLFSYFL